MARVYIKDCMPGDTVEEVFVISGKQLSAASNGTHFIKANISDRTGQINGRMWKATRQIFDAMPEAGFIRIRGKIENYQNNLQLIIDNCWAATDGSFDVSDLLPHTDKHIPTMCKKVNEILGSIQNRHLAALIQTYLDDEPLMTNLCRAPAAQSMHHAFIGGLLEHTLNAMEVADAIAPFYPGLNRDLVIAGIFLHDIAKTWELSYDSAFGYTDGGQLVGHIVKSAMWINEKRVLAEELLGEKIPQDLIDVLHHIILSHHGVPEFGAVKVPATPEAIAVHHIENMDAKLMSALAATRVGRREGEGNWTEYLKPFGGRLYRPDRAPAEAGEPIELESEKDKPGKPVGKIEITNPLFESAIRKPK